MHLKTPQKNGHFQKKEVLLNIKPLKNRSQRVRLPKLFKHFKKTKKSLKISSLSPDRVTTMSLFSIALLTTISLEAQDFFTFQGYGDPLKPITYQRIEIIPPAGSQSDLLRSLITQGGALYRLEREGSCKSSFLPETLHAIGKDPKTSFSFSGSESRGCDYKALHIQGSPRYLPETLSSGVIYQSEFLDSWISIPSKKPFPLKSLKSFPIPYKEIDSFKKTFKDPLLKNYFETWREDDPDVSDLCRSKVGHSHPLCNQDLLPPCSEEYFLRNRDCLKAKESLKEFFRFIEKSPQLDKNFKNLFPLREDLNARTVNRYYPIIEGAFGFLAKEGVKKILKELFPKVLVGGTVFLKKCTKEGVLDHAIKSIDHCDKRSPDSRTELFKMKRCLRERYEKENRVQRLESEEETLLHSSLKEEGEIFDSILRSCEERVIGFLFFPEKKREKLKKALQKRGLDHKISKKIIAGGVKIATFYSVQTKNTIIAFLKQRIQGQERIAENTGERGIAENERGGDLEAPVRPVNKTITGEFPRRDLTNATTNRTQNFNVTISKNTTSPNSFNHTLSQGESNQSRTPNNHTPSKEGSNPGNQPRPPSSNPSPPSLKDFHSSDRAAEFLQKKHISNGTVKNEPDLLYDLAITIQHCNKVAPQGILKGEPCFSRINSPARIRAREDTPPGDLKNRRAFLKSVFQYRHCAYLSRKNQTKAHTVKDRAKEWAFDLHQDCNKRGSPREWPM